jgi:hypothetical protein
MFPISDRVLIVIGDPSQLWAALIIMEKNDLKGKKKLFSRVKYDNLTENCIQGGLFLPKNQLFTLEMDSRAKTK